MSNRNPQEHHSKRFRRYVSMHGPSHHTVVEHQLVHIKNYPTPFHMHIIPASSHINPASALASQSISALSMTASGAWAKRHHATATSRRSCSSCVGLQIFAVLRLLDLTVSQSSVGVKISGVALLSLKHEKGCCSSMRLHPCGSLLLPKIR